MKDKPRYIILRAAGIIFGLVVPLPLTLFCSICGGYLLLPALLAARVALQQRLLLAVFLLWALAGWAGLVSLFSILKSRDYYLRPLNLWQISGLVVCIIAATPWIIIGFNAVAHGGANYPGGDMTPFSLAGPIIVAVVCLAKLKWNIKKQSGDQPAPGLISDSKPKDQKQKCNPIGYT